MNEIMKISILIVLIHKFTLAAPIQDEFDDFRLDLADREVDDEERRRNLGGPWQPEQAFSILNTAVDQITGRPRGNRSRTFEHQAAALLTILTDMEDPIMEKEDEMKDDEYDIDEDIRSSSSPIAESTMQKILGIHPQTFSRCKN